MKNIGVKEVEMVGVCHDTYPTVGKGYPTNIINYIILYGDRFIILSHK